MGPWLRDRVAIITGSGRGIGKEISLAMGQEGARVVTNDCDPGVAESVARQITDLGGQAIECYGDVSKYEIAERLIQTAVDNFGRIDILVNNAGVAAHNMIWNMTEKDWDHVISVNLKGTFNCIRHASSIMKEQRWGRILNTTSFARLGVPEACCYCAAKAGIVGLTKAVALEMSSYGVTCNAYGPGAATRLTSSEELKLSFHRWFESGALPKEVYEKLLNPPPPEKIPPFIIYLCTDEAAGINGEVFNVEGQEILIFKEEVKNSIVKKEEASWTIEELAKLVPGVLLKFGESKVSA
jgi:NAD(P)-dependent dehydrogenase (short-subunit alcohol dehydrogenase family)